MTIHLHPDFLTHGDEALGLPRRRSNWIEPTGKPPHYEGPVDHAQADALAVREWLAHVEAGRGGLAEGYDVKRLVFAVKMISSLRPIDIGQP